MLTITIRPGPDWMTRAACRDADPDIFFPDNGGAFYPHLAEALQVCAACPVRHECLDDAIATGETGYGIRAGLVPKQMRQFGPRKTRHCRAPGCPARAAGTGEHPGYCTDACYLRARRAQQSRSEARRQPSRPRNDPSLEGTTDAA